MAKEALKYAARAIALLLALPWAVFAAFGHFKGGFKFSAQALSLLPSLPGSYVRVAYYSMTLQSCSLGSHISMGSFFSDPHASVGRRVYIGPLCVIGRAHIGDRTQIAAGVQILSGRRQHGRTQDGRLEGSEKGVFQPISIGPDCWIGAGAIVMAEVGKGVTVGAGSVVTRPIPSDSTAVGNPARVIKSRVEN